MYGGRSNTIIGTGYGHIVMEWTKAVIVGRKYDRDIYDKPYYIIPEDKFQSMVSSKHPYNPKLIPE